MTKIKSPPSNKYTVLSHRFHLCRIEYSRCAQGRYGYVPTLCRILRFKEQKMIEVKNLTKRYGSKTAVSNVSFTAEESEILGFLGPNGAGKSTTMNILTGYLSSTEGEAKINGIDILEEPVKAKQ